jgi:hypothetical protein
MSNIAALKIDRNGSMAEKPTMPWRMKRRGWGFGIRGLRWVPLGADGTLWAR